MNPFHISAPLYGTSTTRQWGIEIPFSALEPSATHKQGWRRRIMVWLYSRRSRVAVACLGIILSTPGCLLKFKDSVPSTAQQTPALSHDQPKPNWQAALKAQETDIIQFVGPDRVLIGTIEASALGWGLRPKELMLLNATNGQPVWVAPRNSLGFSQMLLSTDPVIFLQGSAKYVAFSPTTGAIVWERPRNGGDFLFLPGGERILFVSKPTPAVALSAVTLKDGREVWHASISKLSGTNHTVPDVKAVGDAVVLIGAETVALSAKDGQELWRKTFPGKFGTNAAAVVLGKDLFFTDGMRVTKTDPGSGDELWQAEFPGGAVLNLTADERRVFVVLTESHEGSSGQAIEALERGTGKRLWKCPLTEPVESSLIVEGNRIYLTTSGSLIALGASNGSVAFQTAIPPNVKATRVLPDNLRITRDRIIVSRETGVTAFQKTDGNLIFADAVTDGVAFTHDYTTHRIDHARLSSVPLKVRDQTGAQAALAMSTANYQNALAHQQYVYAATLPKLNSGSSLDREMARTDRYVAAKQAEGAARMQMGMEIASGITGASQLGATLIISAVRNSRTSIMEAEVMQSAKNHADALQGDFYIRPRYTQQRGWSLAVVDLNTGDRAEVVLSPQNDALAQSAANLPAFAVDSSGRCLVSKGLGLDPARFQTYHKLGVATMWTVPYPSLLAFDLTALHFAHDSTNQLCAVDPIAPEKQKLNDQLLEAAFRSDVAAVKKALDAGADVNARDEYGQTPLMLAAESLRAHDKKDVVALLIQRGADVTLKDPAGWTASTHFAIISYDAMTSGVSSGISMILKEERKRIQ